MLEVMIPVESGVLRNDKNQNCIYTSIYFPEFQLSIMVMKLNVWRKRPRPEERLIE